MFLLRVRVVPEQERIQVKLRSGCLSSDWQAPGNQSSTHIWNRLHTNELTSRAIIGFALSQGVPDMAGKSQGSGAGGQSKGGQQSGGNFKNDPKRASAAGKKGGEHSHGGTHEQHVEAGKQSHKNK